MPTIRGFFFDLDGTLVNTYEADYRAYHDAILEVTGIDVAQADFEKTHGQEMRDKLDVLAPGLDEADMQKIAAGKKQHYIKYLHLTKANHTLTAFLEDIAKHHITVLVTTAKKQNALAVLDAHGMTKFFKEMVFGDEVTRSKPDPESYDIALQKTGLAPGEVIAFEDSRAGLEAAAAAGISAIHVRSFG